MIKIHRDNRVVFWLLIGGLVMNILWSLRLELQAKATKTIVEKYHLSLNKNKDVLSGLKKFYRSGDDIGISTNDKKMAIRMENIGGVRNIELESDKSRISLHDEGIYMGTGRSGSSQTVINLNPDLFSLGFYDGKQKRMLLTMSKAKDYIKITHPEGFLGIGKPSNNEDLTGVLLQSKKAKMFMSRDSGTLIRDPLDIWIALNKKIHIQLRGDKGKESIIISHHNSKLHVGSKEISIEADGDIDIRSKNGAVKINGKKIHMTKKAPSSQKESPKDEPPIPWDDYNKPEARERPLDEPPQAKEIHIPKGKGYDIAD